MDAQLFENMVSRWVSGDPLTAAEEQSLLEWLQTHPEARKDLLQDETLDSRLRCWPRLEETAEDFVRDCLRRAGVERTGPHEPFAAVAAPPIVAPPVALIHPPRTAGGVPRRRRFSVDSAMGWAAAVAGCSAAIVLGSIGWRWLAHEPQVVKKNQPAPLLAGGRESRPEPDRTFATLMRCDGATWETPQSAGDRLAAGVLKLTAGTAELLFDKGSVVGLTGPTQLELRSGDELFLKRGSLAAKVPRPAVGLLVATPLARIVDLGTEFDVTVEDSGTTQTLVRLGRVSLTPQRGQEDLGTPIELAVGALDRATVSVPNIAASMLPVATVARGDQGRFLGRLSANGKTAEFHSRPAFREFRVQTLKQLREAPNEFGQKWPALAAGANGGIAAKTKAAAERLSPKADVAAGNRGNAAAEAAARDQTIDVQEDGKAISITDSKESGITVTITESEGGKKKMTRVQATDLQELARKNAEAHRFYRKYFQPRPKNGKPK